jgi:ankyrin repeat protein
MMRDENILFDAAFKNDSATIRRELGMGADPNMQHSRSGTLPLQVACQANALEAIQELLHGGADPSRVFSRTSRVDGRQLIRHAPLMYVRSAEAAKALLDAGAEIDFADNNGWTPLVHAINGNEYDVCKYLVEHGATTNLEIVHNGRMMTLAEFFDQIYLENKSPEAIQYNRTLNCIGNILRFR